MNALIRRWFDCRLAHWLYDIPPGRKAKELWVRESDGWRKVWSRPESGG